VRAVRLETFGEPVLILHRLIFLPSVGSFC
jgi:hypothetical protein